MSLGLIIPGVGMGGGAQTATAVLPADRARILLFVPRPTEALICGDYYQGTAAFVGVRYRIFDSAGAVVTTGDANGVGTSFTVTGLTLDVGAVYTCDILYQNSEGYATVRSTPYIARVAEDVGARDPVSTLTPPDLPGGTTITVTIQPSYRQTIEHRRGLIEQRTATNAVIRRTPDLAETQVARLTWGALSLADKDTLLALLDAALNLYDGAIDFADGELSGNVYIIQDGQLSAILVAPDTWEVVAEVIEVRP